MSYLLLGNDQQSREILKKFNDNKAKNKKLESIVIYDINTNPARPIVARYNITHAPVLIIDDNVFNGNELLAVFDKLSVALQLQTPTQDSPTVAIKPWIPAEYCSSSKSDLYTYYPASDYPPELREIVEYLPIPRNLSVNNQK